MWSKEHPEGLPSSTVGVQLRDPDKTIATTLKAALKGRKKVWLVRPAHHCFSKSGDGSIIGFNK